MWHTKQTLPTGNTQHNYANMSSDVRELTFGMFILVCTYMWTVFMWCCVVWIKGTNIWKKPPTSTDRYVVKNIPTASATSTDGYMGTNVSKGPATSTDGYMGNNTSKEPATSTIHGSMTHGINNYCHNFNIDSTNGCVVRSKAMTVCFWYWHTLWLKCYKCYRDNDNA